MECLLPLVLNLSTEKWNDMDDEALSAAKVRCEQIYKEAPCLKQFTKTEPNVYRAICGERPNRKD